MSMATDATPDGMLGLFGNGKHGHWHHVWWHLVET